MKTFLAIIGGVQLFFVVASTFGPLNFYQVVSDKKYECVKVTK
jgi:hypothetical protein